MKRLVFVIAAMNAALLLASAQALATCSALLHPLRTVGDTATDAACTDNDIQSAIDNSDPACTTDIAITREHTWSNQHLTVANKSINFVGQGDGVTCSQVITCGLLTPCPTSAVVTLNAGGSGRVLTVTGTSYVVVGGLTITGGNTTGDGGGISFSGSGALTLYASVVSNNTAANGGGIDVNGSGSGATLTLESNTQVLVNTANGSGGGVRVEGAARLFALLPQTLIAFNHAPNGYGGGVQVVGNAKADIASSGYGSGGVIFYNDAAYGGGISVYGVSETAPLVRLYSVDAANPVRVSQNFASHTGGAVHLHAVADGFSTTGSTPYLCAVDFRLDGNAAQEGTAIYGDADNSIYGGYTGSVVFLDRLGSQPPACDAPEPLTDHGAVACTAGTSCNEIDGNVAQDSLANPTPGATILMQNFGTLDSTALALRGNTGAHAVRTFDTGASLQNCLVVDGTYSAPVFQFENQGQINGGADTEHIQNCTFANNAIGANAVISSAYGLTLLDSIVAQPGSGTLTYTAPDNQLDVQYVVSNDIATLPVATGVLQGTPDFVDAANGDYHLKPTSLGVDFAPAVSGDDRDLDNLPHDQDLAPVPNLYGDRDLGPYELQFLCAADTLFCNGFDAYQ